MSSLLFRRLLAKPVARRNFTTTAVKRSDDPLIGHVEQEAIPGANLPFGINNRYRLLAVMVVFFGSGFTAPFLIARYQLLKKNST